MKPINVTEPFLSPLEEYVEYLKGIWDRNWLTNQGPLVQELERSITHPPYFKAKKFTIEAIGCGMAWFDIETPESFFETGQFVVNIQRRRGFIIAFPKKIAWRMKWIGADMLLLSFQNSGKMATARFCKVYFCGLLKFSTVKCNKQHSNLVSKTAQTYNVF